MSQYSAAALGGALVVIEQASETGSTPYPTPGVVRAPMLQEFIAPALMRPFAMVVHDEFGHGLPKVALPERNDPIQTFFFDQAHEPFGVWVGVRCTIRRLDDVQSRLGQQRRCGDDSALRFRHTSPHAICRRPVFVTGDGGCPQQVAADTKQIQHDAVHQQEPLRVRGRGEPPHLSLALAGETSARLLAYWSVR